MIRVQFNILDSNCHINALHTLYFLPDLRMLYNNNKTLNIIINVKGKYLLILPQKLVQ